MTDIFYSVLLLVGLTVANALLVAGDFGLMKIHFNRLEPGTDGGSGLPRFLAILLRDVNLTSRTIRLAVNLTTVGFGWVLAGFLGEAGASWAADRPWAAPAVVVVAFLTAVGLHFLIGEFVPRVLALNYPEQALRLASVPLHLTRLGMRLPVALLSRLTRAFSRLLRVETDMDAGLMDSEAQVRSILEGGGGISAVTAMILRNAINMKKRVAQDILLPRNQIQYLDLLDAKPVNMDIIRRSGHTRFPLCEGDLDRCIGLVHIKDIVRLRGDWTQVDLRTIRRDILRFSLDDPLDVVLERLLRLKLHMALVTDEFGGTVGVVTLEDVLEELVGDIQDEFDREEILIKPLPDDQYQIDGLAPIHDVAEALGVEIDNDEVSTFGGYIISQLGRMPRETQKVRLGRLEIHITGANEKRITSTVARVMPPENDEEFMSD